MDAADLQSAVNGQDVVVSCLGLRRAGLLPWAPLRSPPDLLERVARLLVATMHAAVVRRLVVLSAGGVKESRRQLSPMVRWMVNQGSIAASYRDLRTMEDVLCASGLDWLAVRPVTLVPGSPTGRAVPVSKYSIWSMVRRSDVAAWMLQAAERTEPFDERAVLLGSG